MLAFLIASVLVSSVAPDPGMAVSVSTPPTQSMAADDLPNGQIIGTVVCAHDRSQSYALYLPTTYSPGRPWPILYAFDPRGRGTVPLERFKEAAERYGWIVVSSNNSRNGPFQTSVDAWNAIVQDTHARFAIDDRRVYTTGFSGGARVAAYLAANCNHCIAGVIPVGAGFPAGMMPSPSLRFSVFGSVGIEDFNLPEMVDLDTALAAAGMAHRLDRFVGRHEWMPSDAAVEAVGWMELQAMRVGTRTRDDRLIAAIRQQTLERARALEDAQHPDEAYRVYAAAAASLKGLADTADIDRRVGELRNHTDVKGGLRHETQEITRQREHEALISALVARSDPARENGPGVVESGGQEAADEPFSAALRLHTLLTDLRKQSQRTEDSAERRVARRVLEGVFISLYEQGVDFLRVRRLYARAVRTFSLATEVAPDRNSTFYYLAWAHAARGDGKKAMIALTAAIEKGFSDLEAIDGNRAFDDIRPDPQFRRAVQTLRDKR